MAKYFDFGDEFDLDDIFGDSKKDTEDKALSVVTDMLIDCAMHDMEMCNRLNLLSALWQDYSSASYRDFTKEFYCKCVERVLSASADEIAKMAKTMTISKGDNEE